MSVSIQSKPPSWLKSGNESKQAFQAAQFQAEKAKEAAGKMRRFFLGVGDEHTVTFLDGNLDVDGMLQFLSFEEHTLQHGGKWENFICVSGQEICPICATGDRASYVGILTVLDHTPYTVQKGPNAGKVYVDQRKLFVAKLNTLRKLQTFAAKRGGLAGWKVEITRTADKEARVGDTFQFLERTTPEDLAAKYGKDAQPANYEAELDFLSAAELIKAGVGQAPTGPGFNKTHGGVVKDYSDEM